MGELTYYLPEIVFGVFALVAIIWGILFVRDMVRRSGGKATCTHCKGNASKLTSPPYLFLLFAALFAPVHIHMTGPPPGGDPILSQDRNHVGAKIGLRVVKLGSKRYGQQEQVGGRGEL